MEIEKYAFYAQKIPFLLKKHLKNTKHNTYLDLGCGDGALLFELNKKKLLENKKIFAIDLSSKRLEKIKKLNAKINCFKNDACNITDIKDKEIGFITTSQVIEHVKDDEKMIKELYRILKDDGKIYLSTVFKKKYAWYFYRCNGKWVLDPTHLREYTKDSELVSLFEKNNFQIIDTRKSLIWFTPINFVLRLLKTKNDTQKNPIINILQNFKIPIPRYRNWEFILKKSQ